MIDVLNDLLAQLANAKAELLLFVALIALGIVLKHAVGAFPNGLIPLALFVAGGGIYFFIGDPGAASHTMRNPEVRLVLIGGVIGLLAWFAHDKALRHAEDWLQRSFRTGKGPGKGAENPS